MSEMTTTSALKFMHICILLIPFISAILADLRYEDNSRNQRGKEITDTLCYLNVTPLHYEIRINATFVQEALVGDAKLKTASATGQVKAKFKVSESNCCNNQTNDNTACAISLVAGSGIHIDFENLGLTYDDSGITIPVTDYSDSAEPVCPGKKFNIHLANYTSSKEEIVLFVSYHLRLKTNPIHFGWQGLFFYDGFASRGDMKYLRPLRAPYMFPYINQNSNIRVPFNVSVSRPDSKHIAVISNTDIWKTKNSSDSRNGWVTGHFQETPPLKLSQVSVMILKDFHKTTIVHYKNDSVNGTLNLNLWAADSSGNYENQTISDSLNVTGSHMLSLVQYFDTKFNATEFFPLNKIDFLVDVQGGRYFWGHSTLGIGATLTSDAKLYEFLKSPKSSDFLSVQIAYQGIGSWIFGERRLCGSSQASDHVMAITRYVAKWAKGNNSDELQGWLTPYTERNVRAETGLLDIFDRVFTRQVLESAVLDFFVPNFKWKDSRPSDFYCSIQGALEKHNLTHLLPQTDNGTMTVLEIFQRRLTSAYYFPRIHVGAVKSDTISLSQEQASEYFSYPGNNFMWIPLIVLTENGEETVWLSPNATTRFKITNPYWYTSSIINTTSWLLINPDGIDYIYVAYDDVLLQNIIEQLSTNHSVFPAAARRFLLHNQFSIAAPDWDEKRKTWDEMSKVFEMATYLQNEDDWLVWHSTLVPLDRFFGEFYQSDAFATFQRYLTALMTPVLAKVGMRPTSGEEEGAYLLIRVMMKYCLKYKLSICTQYSLELLQEFLKKPETNPFSTGAIPENVLEQMYCEGVGRSWKIETEEDHRVTFNSLFSQILKLNSSRDSRTYQLARGLICTKSESLLAGMLNSSEWENAPKYLKDYHINTMPTDINKKFPFSLNEKIFEFWVGQLAKGNLNDDNFLTLISTFRWSFPKVPGLSDRVKGYLKENNMAIPYRLNGQLLDADRKPYIHDGKYHNDELFEKVKNWILEKTEKDIRTLQNETSDGTTNTVAA